jgi:hypothetical protein
MKHPIKMQAIDHDNKFDFINAANTQPEWLAVKRKIYRNCRRIKLPVDHIKPLKTKCRPLYLKTQSIPHSKHFSSRL